MTKRLKTTSNTLAFAFVFAGCSSSSPKHSVSIPDDYPVEDVEEIDCDANRCLLVDGETTYCSFDPFSLTEGAIFGDKSRLTLKAGSYSVSGEGLADLSLLLELREGHVDIEGGGAVNFEVIAETRNSANELLELERLEMTRSNFADGSPLKKIFIRTSSWPYSQFRTGDAEDVFWFFKTWRVITADLRHTKASPLSTVQYGPCEMRGSNDDLFSFAFSDGSALDLTVRTASGVQGIGYYMGRLISAQGDLYGQAVDESDYFNLAFLGSTRSWSENMLPTLVVHTGQIGNRCGIILDSMESGHPNATDGYIAYELTCDEKVGLELELESVAYPETYTIP